MRINGKAQTGEPISGHTYLNNRQEEGISLRFPVRWLEDRIEEHHANVAKGRTDLACAEDIVIYFPGSVDD